MGALEGTPFSELQSHPSNLLCNTRHHFFLWVALLANHTLECPVTLLSGPPLSKQVSCPPSQPGSGEQLYIAEHFPPGPPLAGMFGQHRPAELEGLLGFLHVLRVTQCNLIGFD